MPKDPTSTRDAILDAAERLFARQGFAATTIKQLGTESGVNSALLYYYFADKETLYREMLRRVFGAFAGTAAERIAGERDPEEAIRRFIRYQVEYMTAHPHVPMLLVRELAGQELSGDLGEIAGAAAVFFHALCDVVEQGQRAGVFRADLDPRYAAISVISQVVWIIIARPAAGVFLGHGPEGPPIEVMRDFADHAGDFALAALRAPGAVPGAAVTSHSSTAERP